MTFCVKYYIDKKQDQYCAIRKILHYLQKEKILHLYQNT